MFVFFAALLVAPPVPMLEAGHHLRLLKVDGLQRRYRLYISPKLDRERPAALVLALHGAGMTSGLMESFCGLSKTADQEGFLVAYPDGTRTGGVQTWNAGGLRGPLARGKPDDVRFLAAVIDDIEKCCKVDSTRIYATGMSNGGMMCYRLGNELSERLAAIAPVAGTLCLSEVKPVRPIPLLHLHGTADTIVPYDRPERSSASRFLAFQSAPQSVRKWADAIGCLGEPEVVPLREVKGGRKYIYRTQTGAEAILYQIEGAGHVWPGQPFPLGLIRSEMRLDANALIWEFFKRHPLPKPQK
ncbi:MAG: PHB depolymerase family esterase [Gemmataceae bacterium]